MDGIRRCVPKRVTKKSCHVFPTPRFLCFNISQNDVSCKEQHQGLINFLKTNCCQSLERESQTENHQGIYPPNRKSSPPDHGHHHPDHLFGLSTNTRKCLASFPSWGPVKCVNFWPKCVFNVIQTSTSTISIFLWNYLLSLSAECRDLE